jgi:GAF domain-containing protein
VLRAGTGEPGRLMLAQSHRLQVGGASMIGQCVATAGAVVQLQEGGEALRYANPLLPDTKSELALPMRSRGRVIGAMTVQSEREGAFDEPYIAVLQTMADQVAVGIDNAQLFEAAQEALDQAQEVHRRYLGQAWREYIASKEIGGYEYKGEEVHQRGAMVPLGDEPLAEVWQVIQERQTVLSDRVSLAAAESSRPVAGGEDPPAFALTVPVIQGGQVVAALGFQRGDRAWTAEEIALAEAVAEQLGLALDNQRLLEETQRRAAREEITRQITDRVRAAIDMEEILRVTAQSLSRQLNASEVFVRLGTERTLLGQREVEPPSW